MHGQTPQTGKGRRCSLQYSSVGKFRCLNSWVLFIVLKKDNVKIVKIEISTLAKGLQQQASKTKYNMGGGDRGEWVGSENLFGQLRIKITL